jgi:sugar phosphate isomerase/epimerase
MQLRYAIVADKEMHMTDFSYQLYSSRDWGQTETLTMIGDLGYTQCEGYGAFYNELDALDELKATLKTAGLHMKSGHFSLEMVENDPSKVLDICAELNVQHVYVPYLAPEDRPTDVASWTKFGERLEKASAPFIAKGLIFGWHNHDFEFETLPTGELPQDLIAQAGPSLSFELDIAWVVRGGKDPIAEIKKLGKRITAVHVKDIAIVGTKDDEGGWADVGTGTMDWVSLIAAVKKHTSADLFVIEHDEPSDHQRFASTSIANARQF